MPTYIYQRKNWPKFRWDERRVSFDLARVRYRQGHLIGHMQGLGFSLRKEAMLRALTQDVVKSSEIEGERLNSDQVRSSIARRLGIEIGALTPADRHVEGVVEMMLDATQEYSKPLTRDRLFRWHAALFPTGYSGLHKIKVGGWRTDENGPMQVVSGPIGRERLHYQALPAEKVPREMRKFLNWINEETTIDPVIKAAIAHLWFVTIHPFEDGNGRIARAIADMCLARSEGSAQRFYSMSAQIRAERAAYYNILEATQKGDLDITEWLLWFLGCLDRAFDRANDILANVLEKARFWQAHRDTSFNARQRDMINRLLEGFDGNLTNAKWAKIQKCSSDTALRDISDLVEKGVLAKNASGGRSTSYSLVLGPWIEGI